MPTNKERWSAVALSSPPWDERNKKISAYILPSDVVFDFGAGNQSLSRHAEMRSYTPIDCVDAFSNTYVCDYNKEIRFPHMEPTLIIMSGFLEYIVDLEEFLVALRDRFCGVRCIFSWAYQPSVRSEREEHGWMANFETGIDASEVFKSYFEKLTEIDSFIGKETAQRIYSGVLKFGYPS